MCLRASIREPLFTFLLHSALGVKKRLTGSSSDSFFFFFKKACSDRGKRRVEEHGKKEKETGSLVLTRRLRGNEDSLKVNSSETPLSS